MKNKKVILLIIILLGTFLRFYKLGWGDGLYTHPDEYHIVSSVAQLHFPLQMHPHFFSYGTVTIYLIYFLQAFFIHVDTFIIGRFCSAFFSTLTLLFVYRIAKVFLKTKFALLATFLAAITPGLIQQAHFATPESTLTFFLFGTLFFLLQFIKKEQTKYIVLASVCLGFALGTKIVALLFAPLIVLAILFTTWKKPKKVIGTVSLSFIAIVATFAAVAPYVFLDFAAWSSSTNYEGSLAAGKLLVFYTRQFIDTVPILFQLTKILPYALGLSTEIVGILGLLFFIIKQPKKQFFILVLAFLFLFIPNAFLFTKWTRFIAPTFPFFAIFTAYLLENIYKKYRTIGVICIVFVCITTIAWGVAFFSLYTKPDVRIVASQWIQENTPKQSTFLVEGGNMIDVPLGGSLQKTSLDFYNLEDDKEARQKIIEALVSSDYFIVQSRRVFYNHQRLPDLFPKTAHFYDALFAGSLGFELIKEFQSYPSLTVGNFRWVFPDETAEETWSVFDHPVIRIFQKKTQLTKKDYEKIFEN